MRIKGLQALKNIAYMYMAQLTQMLLSIVLSLYIPIVMGLIEYSYWQLFIFYSTYVGMLHLGLNDGVYLKYGGMKLKKRERQLISDQLWMSMSIQVLILVLLFVFLVLYSPSVERMMVWGTVLIYAIVNNIFNYCGSVLQAINKIKLYSVSVVTDKLFVVVSIITITIWGNSTFLGLIICYIIGKALATTILLIKNKDIFLCRFCFCRLAFREMVTNIGFGCNLMFANIVSSLIIGIGRFFIDLNYPVETFGVVSFAFTMTGFVLVLVSQVGSAVFPILKAKDDRFLMNIYPRLNRFLSLSLPYCLLGYPLIVVFIISYLPHYKDSLNYFVFLLPMCIYEAKTTMLYNTFIKVIRKEQMLLAYNLISLMASLFITIVAVYFYHSLSLLIIGLVFSVIFKSILLHLYICGVLHLPKIKNFVFSDLLIGVTFVLFIQLNSSLLRITLGLIFVLALFTLFKAKTIISGVQELFIYQEK